MPALPLLPIIAITVGVGFLLFFVASQHGRSETLQTRERSPARQMATIMTQPEATARLRRYREDADH